MLERTRGDIEEDEEEEKEQQHDEDEDEASTLGHIFYCLIYVACVVGVCRRPRALGAR